MMCTYSRSSQTQKMDIPARLHIGHTPRPTSAEVGLFCSRSTLCRLSRRTIVKGSVSA